MIYLFILNRDALFINKKFFKEIYLKKFYSKLSIFKQIKLILYEVFQTFDLHNGSVLPFLFYFPNSSGDIKKIV